MIEPTFVAAIAAAGVGFAAFWSNPGRAINKFFFSSSIHVALWLLALHQTAVSEDGLLWLRVTTAIGAFIPLHLWFLKEAVVHGESEALNVTARRGILLIVASCVLASITFTHWFIPAYSTAEIRVYGIGYYVFIASTITILAALLRQTVVAMRHQQGVTRLELQLLLLGGCAIAAAILALMAIRALSPAQWATKLRLQPIIILFFYSCTAIAITTHRIFDARQLLLVGAQKIALVTAIAGFGFGAYATLDLLLPSFLAMIVTTGLSLSLAAGLSGWFDRIFQFYPEAKIARQAAFTAAQRENRTENLERSFLAVLKGWGQSDRSVVITGGKETMVGQGIELPGDGTVMHALRQLVWATPERLARERPNPQREALGQFLAEHQLGITCLVDGPSLTLLVGVGYSASRRPFTYPQVTQLMELASIMESAIERAHFSAKAQHTEQLATVGLLGASIAHEIRNPLVSIKTFVQLLPTHHQDPAFREKFFRLIGDEVSRIDQLTEQLLDLASPRTYSVQQVELHPVLRTSLDLVAAKAAHKNIEFFTEFRATPDVAYTDASAARQVMLNLCFNAIQAVEANGHGARWVKIATRNTENGIEMAVADSGPGISEDIRTRLFQPFHTTKSTGFGLGLAICSDILANLDASISVDPPTPGAGATFRVIFPCQPLSS